MGNPLYCPICGEELTVGYRQIKCSSCYEPFNDLHDLDYTNYVVSRVMEENPSIFGGGIYQRSNHQM